MTVYIDSGSEDYSVEAAISKVFASEALQCRACGLMRDQPGANHAGLPHSHDIRGNQRGIAAVYSPVGAQYIYAMPQLLRGQEGISAWPRTFAEPSGMRTRR
jgi:hypothetical protein